MRKGWSVKRAKVRYTVVKRVVVRNNKQNVFKSILKTRANALFSQLIVAVCRYDVKSALISGCVEASIVCTIVAFK